jgi:outer membrane protein OmpU
MKKILLATTMLVGGASIAAAEVSVSGTARMGLVSGFSDGVAANGDESDVVFNSRVRVIFTLSNETDSGLAFGASIRADNAAAGAAGDAGEVFISGAFGKLSMGDVDGAAQMATGHVAGVGYVGIGDLNESTFLGCRRPVQPTRPLCMSTRPATSPSTRRLRTLSMIWVPLPPVRTDLMAMAIGAKYTFGDYTVGLGYENLDGFRAAAVGAAVFPLVDNTDLDHIVLKLSGNVAGFNVQGLIGQADGTLSGAVIDNAKQYAMSVGYTVDALSGTVFYTDDSALGGSTAYGIGASTTSAALPSPAVSCRTSTPTSRASTSASRCRSDLIRNDLREERALCPLFLFCAVVRAFQRGTTGAE